MIFLTSVAYIQDWTRVLIIGAVLLRYLSAVLSKYKKEIQLL